jgi:hypothetical protein
VLLLRRLCVVIACVLLDDRPETALIAVVCVFVLALVAHCTMRPYTVSGVVVKVAASPLSLFTRIW